MLEKLSYTYFRNIITHPILIRLCLKCHSLSPQILTVNDLRTKSSKLDTFSEQTLDAELSRLKVQLQTIALELDSLHDRVAQASDEDNEQLQAITLVVGTIMVQHIQQRLQAMQALSTVQGGQ